MLAPTSTLAARARRPARTALGALLALGACLLLAACSMAGLAYNNAVPLASWYLDDYVSLDDGQQDQLRQSLGRLHAWHRRSELPEYGRLLESAAARVDGPVQAEDILALYADGRRVLTRLAEQALPDTVDLLLTLTPAQIDAIEARLRKDNEKYQQERMKVPPAQRERERQQRYLRNVETWMGSLDSNQRAMLAAGLAEVPVGDDARLADRRRLQGDFIALLRSAPSKARMTEQLRRLMLSPESGRAPDYARQSQRWREANAALLARLVNEATPSQRRQLQRRLRDYATDAQTLASSR